MPKRINSLVELTFIIVFSESLNLLYIQEPWNQDEPSIQQF